MNNNVVLIISVIAIITAFFAMKNDKFETFDAMGLVFNQPPEWFHKAAYNREDWIVNYYPDQLAQPGGCDMHYRGDPKELNWEASCYKFWRM